MIPLPYFEDIARIYTNYVWDTLFPNIKKNKYIVYSIAFLHVLGTLQIAFGVFLPPKYQFAYFIYLVLIALSYFFFKGHCFMTLLANKYSGKKESPLHIRMKTARTILFFNMIFAFFGSINPNWSLFKILQRVFSD